MFGKLLHFLRRWLLPPGIWAVLVKVSTPGQSRQPGAAENTASSRAVRMTGAVEADGWELFRSSLLGARFYGEYGVGKSTVWCARRTQAQIQAADTSKEWVEAVSSELPGSHNIIHVDLGPVHRWGRPVGYEMAHRFDDYFRAPFASGFAPDLVFIDGRFRVACFATALLLAKPGTRILIDDYPMRPNYHVIEQLLIPVELSVRQALFVRPERIDKVRVAQMLEQFRFVMD